MRRLRSSGIVKGNNLQILGVTEIIRLPGLLISLQAESSSSLKPPTDTLRPVSLDTALPVGQTNTGILLRAEALQQPLYKGLFT